VDSVPRWSFRPPRVQDSPPNDPPTRLRAELRGLPSLITMSRWIDWPTCRGAQNSRLLPFNACLGFLEGLQLNVHIIDRRFSVHVSELRHHDPKLHASMSTLRSESVAQIMESKPLHLAGGHQLSPRFDPAHHWSRQIQLLVGLPHKMTGFPSIEGQ